jgi:putative flippase GtrA
MSPPRDHGHNSRLAKERPIDALTSTLLRLATRFERVIRYGFVGAGVTLFYTLLTVGLISGHVISDPTLACAFAFVITQPVSYLSHRLITYADVASDRSQWRRFGTIALAGFAVTTGTMKLDVVLGWPYWIALVIGWFLIPVVNYLINAVWVFRAKSLLALDRTGADHKVSDAEDD